MDQVNKAAMDQVNKAEGNFGNEKHKTNCDGKLLKVNYTSLVDRVFYSMIQAYAQSIK